MGYGGAVANVWNQRTTFEPFPYGLGFGIASNDQDSELLLKTIDQIPAISVVRTLS